MTQVGHRTCGDVYGCVIAGHTDRDCYWRYVDNAMDLPDWLRFTVMSLTKWTGEKHRA